MQSINIMPVRPMVGCRVPLEWKEKLEAIANDTGRNTAQLVYQAVEQYLMVVEEDSVKTRILELLQYSETLKENPLISSLSQRLEAVEGKLSSIQAVISALTPASPTGGERGIPLTAEQLSVILNVTPRAINQAAAKGHEHFTAWSKRHSKGGKWGFEVINPGAKKCDRRFFSIY